MEKVKEKSSFFRKFVGDKRFYLMVLSIAVPIMVQNGITNFVSLLDNIMIGRIGCNVETASSKEWFASSNVAVCFMMFSFRNDGFILADYVAEYNK